MYVKKFEAETLDEALRSVKSELGPDAIILKTITNKGLKGAFKKSRVEITAAISEQSYTKKANVDRALGDHKKDFYQAPSSSINHMINEYNEHSRRPSEASAQAPSGYGSMGLNKVVNTVSKASHKFKNSLDDFLAPEEDTEEGAEDLLETRAQARPEERVRAFPERSGENESPPAREERGETRGDFAREPVRRPNDYEMRLKAQLDSQKKQIELLEQKLFDLSKNAGLGLRGEEEERGLKELRDSLRSLDLSESIVARIVKKARFELGADEREDEDALFDLALRELNSLINVEMPLFSSANPDQDADAPVVTALISEASCGQTSMAVKLAVLMENAKIIRLRSSGGGSRNEFAQSVFKLDISNVETLSHLMSEARKAIEAKRPVLLDIKANSGKEDESKKILDTLNRSFKRIEILANISAIHSELYNRKILSKYKDRLNGVIISYVDQCLNYGALVNTHCKHDKLPLKFFGTGPVVPDDIEGATAERILAGMFNL